MYSDSTDAAWAAARAAEPDGMGRDEIAGLLADVRRARSCLDAIEVRASRRVRELAAIGRAEPAESMIANAGGHGGGDARSITERDELCAEMPDVEDALVVGEITGGHIDAMSATPPPPPAPRPPANRTNQTAARAAAPPRSTGSPRSPHSSATTG